MIDIKAESKGLVTHGMTACAGCGLEVVYRRVLEVLGEDTIFVIPPGCAAAFCGTGRECATKLAGMQGNLENTAALASGIKAALHMKGNDHTTVLGFAGDGGTVDIGLQALSGAMERGEKILYICYDNEAYMNTGIQGSSSTPAGAWTTTTPGGKPQNRKDLIGICMAHNIPYCATASVAEIFDLQKKVEKAKEATKCGTAVIHVHAPCPTGWRYPSSKTIEIARKAILSHAWNLYEVADGKVSLTKKVPNPIDIEEYLSMQGRFKGITAEEKAYMAKAADNDYAKLAALSLV